MWRSCIAAKRMPAAFFRQDSGSRAEAAGILFATATRTKRARGLAVCFRTGGRFGRSLYDMANRKGHAGGSPRCAWVPREGRRHVLCLGRPLIPMRLCKREVHAGTARAFLAHSQLSKPLPRHDRLQRPCRRIRKRRFRCAGKPPACPLLGSRADSPLSKPLSRHGRPQRPCRRIFKMRLGPA